MIWKTAKINEIKFKSKFAWFPKKLDDGYTVWLQNYFSKEIFKEVTLFSYDEFGLFEDETILKWVSLKTLSKKGK